MAYVPLSGFLFRAPLLPLEALKGSRTNVWTLPLARAGLELASPDLAAAVDAGAARPPRSGHPRDNRVRMALDRYRRRAAFRPTPHGLWAGVGLGALGARTQVDTGEPTAVFGVSWRRLAELARALLDNPAVRAEVRLRLAPSVIVGAHTVVWLAPGADGLVEEKRAELDDLLVDILRATEEWTPWGTVAGVVHGDGDADGDGVDELLMTIIDDGLLHFDLVPPLVGPPPLDWMLGRLARGEMDLQDAAAGLEEARAAAAAGDHQRLRAALMALPGSTEARMDISSTLVFRPTTPMSLSRAAVERAARLAPLLFRLQEALAPPIAERTPAAALGDALAATTEIFGAGAIDLAALQLGEYGVTPHEEEADAVEVSATIQQAPPRELITVLLDAVMGAVRRGSPEVRLRSDELEPLLPSVELPATCELFLTPAAAVQGEPAGQGWLAALHAPAGASWGRFAFALGEEVMPLLKALTTAEERARPGERRIDVLFSPSDALADICAHPPARTSTLALTGWPADDSAAITVAELELCADASALETLGLRTSLSAARDGAEPIAPASLHRVRSSMAPAGIWRLLMGWNLYRQHAPWAVTLGPLSELAWIPRLSIDGFVVAPASWRVPKPLATRGSEAALRVWRRQQGVPRHVQVGAEDELLPVDLQAPTAAADLAGHERVFEIWPPLGDTPDRAGRRIEAVIALADQPEPEEQAHIAAALAAIRVAGVVPPPRATADAVRASAGPEKRWETFKLFGAADRQDGVLVDVVAPVVREARDAAEIESWFFLRYEEGPGRRPHLRFRVRFPKKGAAGAADPTAASRFARRLERRLVTAWRAGDVVGMERTAYFPETARFGGWEVMEAVHALFEASSELVCALLTAEGDPGGDQLDGIDTPDERIICLVGAHDALARGLGLDAGGRKLLARRRRDAHASEMDLDTTRQHGRSYRALGTRLRELLDSAQSRTPADGVAPALERYGREAALAAKDLSPERRLSILPPLLHLSSVRLLGPDRAAEIRAYDFWARTLESLERHPGR